jgi:uncharacterized membrane protein
MASALCVLFIALAVPLILQKVPINCVYGFRTRKTMANAATWYKANRFFGCGLVVAALVSLFILNVGALYPDVIPPPFVHEHSMFTVVLPVGVLLVVSAFYHRTL